MRTAFPPPGGWSIWVREPDGVRQFIVATTKEADAWAAVKIEVPTAHLLSSEPLTRDLLSSLGIAQGNIVERIARASCGPATLRVNAVLGAASAGQVPARTTYTRPFGASK
jgi:hypothetical protein